MAYVTTSKIFGSRGTSNKLTSNFNKLYDKKIIVPHMANAVNITIKPLLIWALMSMNWRF